MDTEIMESLWRRNTESFVHGQDWLRLKLIKKMIFKGKMVHNLNLIL